MITLSKLYKQGADGAMHWSNLVNLLYLLLVSFFKTILDLPSLYNWGWRTGSDKADNPLLTMLRMMLTPPHHTCTCTTSPLPLKSDWGRATLCVHTCTDKDCQWVIFKERGKCSDLKALATFFLLLFFSATLFRLTTLVMAVPKEMLVASTSSAPSTAGQAMVVLHCGLQMGLAHLAWTQAKAVFHVPPSHFCFHLKEKMVCGCVRKCHRKFLREIWDKN